MIPSLPINDISEAYSCSRAARHSQDRIRLLNFTNNCTAISPFNPLRARSDRTPHRIDSAKISFHLSCRRILSITGKPKSP
jgi:hypothetical protein